MSWSFPLRCFPRATVYSRAARRSFTNVDASRVSRYWALGHTGQPPPAFSGVWRQVTGMAGGVRISRTYWEATTRLRRKTAMSNRGDQDRVARADRSGAHRPHAQEKGGGPPVWPERSRNTGHSGQSPPALGERRRWAPGMAGTVRPARADQAPTARMRLKQAVKHRNGHGRIGRPDMLDTHRRPSTRSGGGAPEFPAVPAARRSPWPAESARTPAAAVPRLLAARAKALRLRAAARPFARR